MANIGLEVQTYKTLKERLALAYSLEDDDEALLDTLDGELPLTDIIVKMVREAKQAEAYAKGIKSIIADNQARKKRLEDKADKLRGLAAWAMGECGLSKISEADLTISQHKGPSVLVLDVLEPTHLDTYTKQNITYSWDKEALQTAVEAGDEEALTIAHMSNAKSVLTVRCK